ncbi:hypothetical protein Tco_1168904 [Tanacetum coccineum]
MASAIICLAINQKFNFSKYIFDNMVKNLVSENKFWMYPRFVQVFLDKQVGDISTHDEIYVTPSHTKKVFGNMKRVGKGFSGNITPLFPTMTVQAQEEMGKGSANPTDPLHTPIITQPSTLQPQKNNLGGNREKTLRYLNPVDRMKLNELMKLCTQLRQRVLDLENTKTAQAQEITSLKKRVKKLEKKQRLRPHKLKRLYKVGLNIDADKDITLDTTHFDIDHDMFGVHDLDSDEVFVETKEPVVNAATTTSTILVSVVKDLFCVDMTLAQALAELRHAKPKAVTTTATTTTTVVTRPKAKGLVIQEQK